MGTQTNAENSSPASTPSPKSFSKPSRTTLYAGLFILVAICLTGALVWFLFFKPKSVKVEVPPTADRKETSVSTSGISMNPDSAAIRNTVDDLYKDSAPAGNQKANPTVPNQTTGQARTDQPTGPGDTIDPSGSGIKGTGVAPTLSTAQGKPPVAGQDAQLHPISLVGERSVRFGQPFAQDDSGKSQRPVTGPENGHAARRSPSVSAPQTGIVSRVNGLDAVRPPFNTVIPFRLQGTVSTLFPGSTVRMEVTRECRGTDWSIPAGTILVGQVQAARRDRIQIAPIGYLDDRSQKLISLRGEIRDAEGEIGIRGNIQREQGLLQRAAARAFNVGVTLVQSFLQSRGRGTNVVVPAVTGTAQDIGGTNLASLQRLSNADFVIAKAGTEGTLLVTELPEGSQVRIGRFSNSEPELPAAGPGLSDDEALEILRRGNRDEISQSIPRMSETIQLVAKELLKELP